MSPDKDDSFDKEIREIDQKDAGANKDDYA